MLRIDKNPTTHHCSVITMSDRRNADSRVLSSRVDENVVVAAEVRYVGGLQRRTTCSRRACRDVDSENVDQQRSSRFDLHGRTDGGRMEERVGCGRDGADG
jgi:hypothetical protein